MMGDHRRGLFCAYVRRRRMWRLVRVFELHQRALASGDKTSLRMVRRLAAAWRVEIRSELTQIDKVKLQHMRDLERARRAAGG